MTRSLQGRGSKPRDDEQRESIVGKLKLEIYMLCKLHNMRAQDGAAPEMLARMRGQAETKLAELKRHDPEGEYGLDYVATP